MKSLLLLISIVIVNNLFAISPDSLPVKNNFNLGKNKIYLSYAPTFINDDKMPFHGVEITYERNIIKLFSISFTQGFYTTKKIIRNYSNYTTSRQDYYFNSYATLQLIPYSNSFYELKIGVGPSLFYRNVVNYKSNDINFPLKGKYFDKGVLGGIHFNFENNFYIKKHILLGVKFEPQIIFPKKNRGDRILLLRPAFNFGYRF